MPPASTPKTPSVALYLAELFDQSRKTQKEIAADLGYDHPNIISMFKHGLTRLPVEKVPAMADALGVSQRHLLRMVLAEYHPQMLAVIETLTGPMLTENEVELVATVRRLSGGRDPAFRTGKAIDLLTQAVSS